MFEEILDTFENEDVKEFMITKCTPTICAYFKIAPASSSGKYHPQISLGEGGLMRHTIAVARFLNHMFGVESVANQFTSRERDLLRVAALMHDSRKSGSQEDYEKSKWTKFNHPLLAAEVIRGLTGLPQEEIEVIATTIEAHMGAFNTDKRHPDIIIPKPTNKYQIILHLADYLASRKDIEMKFEGFNGVPEIIPNPEDVYIQAKDYKIPFGKYKDMTISEVAESDLDYLKWMGEKIDPGNTKTMVNIFLKEYGKKDEKV